VLAISSFSKKHHKCVKRVCRMCGMEQQTFVRTVKFDSFVGHFLRECRTDRFHRSSANHGRCILFGLFIAHSGIRIDQKMRFCDKKRTFLNQSINFYSSDTTPCSDNRCTWRSSKCWNGFMQTGQRSTSSNAFRSERFEDVDLLLPPLSPLTQATM
jgi:hypothetical protein